MEVPASSGCCLSIASMLPRDEDKIDEKLNSQRGVKGEALDIRAEVREPLPDGTGSLCRP